MKKTLNLTSRIIFFIMVIVFGITLITASASVYFPDIFDSAFGGPTQVLLDATEYEEDTVYYKSWYQSVDDLLQGNKAVAAAAMAEGAALLRNKNKALPLDKGDNVSLFGVGAYNVYYVQSGGAVCIIPPDDDKQTYQSEFEKAGLNVNTELADWYMAQPQSGANSKFHTPVTTGNGTLPTYNGIKWNEVEASGKVPSSNGGTAVFVITRSGNESADLRGFGGGDQNQNDLALFENERDMLDGLKGAKLSGKFDKIVMIINASSTIQEDLEADFDYYGVDAAFWIGTPGNAGLAGLANLFVGESTPSGSVADMWYSKREYSPTHINFRSGNTSGVNSNNYTLLQEGMYLGYRYAETRYEDFVMGRQNAGTYDYAEQVAYPFGYGLSYTTFSFSDMQVTPPATQDGEYTVKVTVKNTGMQHSGKKVVQLYAQKPYTTYDVTNHIEKPSVELVGFAKTKKLAPNTSETVEIKVDANRYLADYDAYGKGKYILEAGKYYLTAASDSHDAINNILALKKSNGESVSSAMDAAGNSALAKIINITAATESDFKYKTNAGKEASNLFDFADPNRCDPDAPPVTFMSRNNWTGTVFSTRTTVANSTKRRAGAVHDNNGTFGGHTGAQNKDPDAVYPTYSTYSDGTEIIADAIDYDKMIPLIDMRLNEKGEKLPFDDPRWQTFLDQLSWNDTVLLLSNGRRGTLAVRSVSKPATTEPNGPCGFMWAFNATSGKWQADGFAARFRDPDASKKPIAYPSPTIVAGTFNTELMYAVGQAFGEDGLWAGNAGIYSFTLGLHRNPYHGRSGENFSEDPFLTGMTAAMYAKGMNTKGVYTYMKHLVLNDIEQNRTSYESWITEQALRQLYLRPFEMAIQIGGAKNIMSSFARVGSYWAGSNYNLCTSFMRGECALEGFIVTDYYRTSPMGMLSGLMAGNDLPDGPVGTAASYQNDGTISVPNGNEYNGRGPEGSSAKGPNGIDELGGYGHLAQAMRLAAHRIMYVTVHSNAMNYISSGTQIMVYPAAWNGILSTVVTVVSIVFGVSAAFVLVMTTWSILDKRKV